MFRTVQKHACIPAPVLEVSLSPLCLAFFAFLGGHVGDGSRGCLDLLPTDIFWACGPGGSRASASSDGERDHWGGGDCDTCKGRWGGEGREGADQSDSMVLRVMSAFQLLAHKVRRGAAASSSRRATSHSLVKKVLKYFFLRTQLPAHRSVEKRLARFEYVMAQAEAQISFHWDREIPVLFARRMARCVGGRDLLLCMRPTSGSLLQSLYVQRTDCGRCEGQTRGRGPSMGVKGGVGWPMLPERPCNIESLGVKDVLLKTGVDEGGVTGQCALAKGRKGGHSTH